MTVPQHRLVVKGAADRWGSRRAEERAGATHKPECRAMRNASGALLLPALALGGEQLRRQEGRLPRCLKGGMLLLTPTPPPGPLQEETKPLRPTGLSTWPPCHTAEGLCCSCGPGGRELSLREKKRFQQRQEPVLPLQKRWLHLCFITRRDSDRPGQCFPRQTSPGCLPFLWP